MLRAVTGVVPFIAIVELARTLLPAVSGGWIDVGRVWLIVAVAVVALFVSFGAAFASGLVSHLADRRGCSTRCGARRGASATVAVGVVRSSRLGNGAASWWKMTSTRCTSWWPTPSMMSSPRLRCRR